MGNVLSAYQTSECQVNFPGKGSIRGVQFDDKACQYAEVPYAVPPVREPRWRKPQPLPSSRSYSPAEGESFDATQLRAICHQPQYSKSVKKETRQGMYSEDCLRLNIWTPVRKPGEVIPNWPVMVWFHGGWFQIGDPSQEPGMNPTELISTGGLNAVLWQLATVSTSSAF